MHSLISSHLASSKHSQHGQRPSYPSLHHTLIFSSALNRISTHNSRPVEWTTNVSTVRTTHVTSGVVVADGKVRRDAGTDTTQTLGRTVHSSTSDTGAGLPDNLAEVTPVLKVGHVRVGSAVQAVEPVDLTVVEEVGNDVGDLRCRSAGGNVLTVAAATSSGVVGVVARVCNFKGNGGEGCVPGGGRGGVVGTVDVVVGESYSGVASGGRSGGACNRGGGSSR